MTYVPSALFMYLFFSSLTVVALLALLFMAGKRLLDSADKYITVVEDSLLPRQWRN
jgi:hypothetical protein